MTISAGRVLLKKNHSRVMPERSKMPSPPPASAKAVKGMETYVGSEEFTLKVAFHD